MKRRKLFVAMAAVGMAATVGTVFFRAAMTGIPSSEKHRVLDRAGWAYRNRMIDERHTDEYTWLDNRTILFFVPDAQGRLQAMKQQVGVGQTFRAEALPAAVSDLVPFELVVSPNGKFLAVSGWDKSKIFSLEVFDLNGKGRLRQYRAPNAHLHWLADSRTLIGSDETKPNLVRYTLDSPKPEMLPFASKQSSGVVVAPDGTCFAHKFQFGRKSFGTLERSVLVGGQSGTKTIPASETVRWLTLVSVAPQGNRLLWCENIMAKPLTSQKVKPLTTQLKEKFYPSRTPSANVSRWYVTDADGSHAKTFVTSDASILPKWLPDGKQFSMVYEGALYVEPVP